MDKLLKNKNILFHVYKNTNNHIVVYEWVEEKIDMYWLNLDDDTKKVKLTSLEKKMAYGIKKKGDKIRLSCAPKTELKIKDNKVVLKIDKRNCYLRDVYSHIEGKYLGFPNVKYVILTGICVVSGEIISEKIEK